MAKIGFIGAGNMAEALIKGIISAKLVRPKKIYISDISLDRISKLKTDYKLNTCHDNIELIAQVDIVILATKPQHIPDVLEQIATHISPDKLIISIAAGITTAKINTFLPNLPTIRVMPNTPALIGQGASVLFANKNAEQRLKEALKIFNSVGKAFVISDESLLDAITAVSGSGPAYFFLLIEEMINAAKQLGLDADLAKQLVLQTAKGAALLAEKADKTGRSPAQLRKNVTSPGGTTEAALKVFNDEQFSAAVLVALQRAAERSKQLSES